MSFKLNRVHLWSGQVPDKVGGTATKLHVLAEAGANLEYVFTKRLPDKPGLGVLFVAPLSGAVQLRAAKAADLHETDYPVVYRIEGDNAQGLAHRLTHDWAVQDISLQGLTMAVVGNKFVAYAAFDTVEDGMRAAQILADIGFVAPEK